MLDLILGVAKADERIRAVYMNGSRTNPNAAKDKYRDYDIVYVVTETEPFIADEEWINRFGDILMLQQPDSNDMKGGFYNEHHDFFRSYAWLMLFKDGNRIDLNIEIKEEAATHFLEDKLTVLLLDKDGFLPAIKAPSDADYHVKKPSEGKYFACCNDFWWCLNNVAKGIAHDELPYAMEMFNSVVRPMLKHAINWYIGVSTDFSVSAGKMGKCYKKYLPPELYELYLATYSDGDAKNIWASIFAACELFRITAKAVADALSFTYIERDDANMTAYLENVMNDSYMLLA